MSEAICLVTAVMSSTWLLVKAVKDQYIGSAIDLKTWFRILKSDIKTKNDRCGTGRYFKTKCSEVVNPHRFLQVQLIQSVVNDLDLKNNLWERQK